MRWIDDRLAGLGFLLLLILPGSALAAQSSVPATVAAVPSPAASPGATGSSLPIDSSAQSIVVNGMTRTYRVYRPADLPGPAPLVVMLHGGGGSGAHAEKLYGWDKMADQYKFLVAYPDGIGERIPAWNTEGGCCGQPARDNIDDVGFITAMVRQIEVRADIDSNRIYATGMSNGGMLAYTLACKTDLFAAIGPVSATMLNSCPDPHPISVIHIHGLQDTNIPFNGGQGQGIAHINGPVVPDVIADWRRIDNCQAPVTTTAGVVTTAIATCPDGRAVELITVADAGHSWPGPRPKSTQATVGGKPTSQAIDATNVIWQFFAAHPRAGE